MSARDVVMGFCLLMLFGWPAFILGYGLCVMAKEAYCQARGIES